MTQITTFFRCGRAGGKLNDVWQHESPPDILRYYMQALSGLLVERLAYRVLLHLGKKVLVTLLLLSGLVAHPCIDQFLLGVRRKDGRERVSQSMPSCHNFPLAMLDGSLKVIRRLAFRQRHELRSFSEPNIRSPLRAIGRSCLGVQIPSTETSFAASGYLGFVAEQTDPARVLGQPLFQDVPEHRSKRHAAERLLALDTFFLANQDLVGVEIDIRYFGSNQLAAAGPGVGGHSDHRIDEWMASRLPDMIQKRLKLFSSKIQRLP